MISTPMNTSPFSLPPAPDLVKLLAGYAQWAQILSATNPNWQADDLTAESLQQIQLDFGGASPANLVVYQTHISGLNWNGEFERPAYLCLCEAEATMVTNEVQQPSRKVRRLYFSWWMHVRVQPVPLLTVLTTPEGRKHLHERLRTLLIYARNDYLQAESLCFWMQNGGIGQWLYQANRMMPPLHPEKNIPIGMRFGNPSTVWSSEGLGGLIDGEGDCLLPCHYAYLSSPHSGLIEVRKVPLPPVQPPVTHFDFMQFTCDIVDYRTGRQVNPPGISALQDSLCVMGDRFVACREGVDIVDAVQPRMGFMNANSEWLGRSDWADVLLFNEYLAAVNCPDSGLWGFIDRNGDVAVPPRYADGSFFNDGAAIVPLPKEQAVDDARWVLINTLGEAISGPWLDIKHGQGDTYLVSDGANRWGVIHQRGTVLVNPIAFAPDASEDKRQATLQTRYREQRLQGLVERFVMLPLAEAVAGLELKRERDFFETSLWGKKVNVLHVPAHWQDTFGPTTQGRIGWSYPASASLFDFDQECPVLLDRELADPLSLGIPWGDLELCK